MRRAYYTILKFCLFTLFTFNQTFACNDLLTVNPDKVPVPEMATAPGMGGITEFTSENNNCTLDCRCVYKAKTTSWDVVAPPNQICVFMNQCKLCKNTDKECKIAFIDLQSSSLYKATFYANQPNNYKVQQCIHEKDKPISCKIKEILPDYDSVKPISGATNYYN